MNPPKMNNHEHLVEVQQSHMMYYGVLPDGALPGEQKNNPIR